MAEERTAKAKSPAVAMWLLTRLVSAPARDALVGDLVEQVANGRRSRGWSWWQAIGAIGVDLSQQLLQHRGDALRALEAGWLVLLALVVFVNPTVSYHAHQLGMGMVDRLFFDIEGDPQTRFNVLGLIARLPPMIWVWTMAAAAGWAVGRVHRREPHRAAMVLFFAATVTIIVLPRWIIGFTHTIADQRLIERGHWPVVQGMLIAQFVTLAMALACLVIAGLWGVSAPIPPAGDASESGARSHS